MKRHIPILAWAGKYKRSDFKGDIVAALTVAVMLIPQSMAVAMLAGLPPVMGLYASVAPLLIYAFFGTSRHLSVGPVAIVSLLVASSVSDLAAPGSATYIVYATALAGVVGIVQITMGAARFGFLVNFLSHPVISGFTSAAAVIIAISQMENILGFKTGGADGVDNSLLHFLDRLPEIHLLTLAVGLSSLIVLFVLKRIKMTFPRALVVVVLTTLASRFMHLEEAGVRIVGDVPKGLHPFAVPDVDPATLGTLVPIGVAIALIAFMESIAIAKKFGREFRYEVDGSKELVALGLANVGACTFGGYPVTGSFARTAMNAYAGAKTSIASVITALTVALTVLFLTEYFYYLPRAALAALIIDAVSGLIDVGEVRHLHRVKRMDLASLIFTFVATLALGVELGLAISILVSAVLLIRRTTRPHHAILGRLPDTIIYRNVSRYPEARTVDGVLMVRIDGSLYFANASFLKEVIQNDVKQYKKELRAVVFDASSINDIDSSADTALHETADWLLARGIYFCLTNVKGPVRDVLMRSGLYEKLGGDHFFFRNHDAIRHLTEEHDVPHETQSSANGAPPL